MKKNVGKMDQLMWRSHSRSRTKSPSRSLGAVHAVQRTISIHSAYLLKSQLENKKLSWSVWIIFRSKWYSVISYPYLSPRKHTLCSCALNRQLTHVFAECTIHLSSSNGWVKFWPEPMKFLVDILNHAHWLRILSWNNDTVDLTTHL